MSDDIARNAETTQKEQADLEARTIRAGCLQMAIELMNGLHQPGEPTMTGGNGGAAEVTIRVAEVFAAYITEGEPQ
ncbi:MAG: hypothetical protein ABIJ75_03240 [Actinomycetota bacterium]